MNYIEVCTYYKLDWTINNGVQVCMVTFTIIGTCSESNKRKGTTFGILPVQVAPAVSLHAGWGATSESPPGAVSGSEYRDDSGRWHPTQQGNSGSSLHRKDSEGGSLSYV
jgi:hypothetical protein